MLLPLAYASKAGSPSAFGRLATLVVLGLFGATAPDGAARADEPLTLEAALRDARTANARLPVARADLESSRARLRLARGQRWPVVSAEGDLRYATPASAFPTNGSEERLELFVRGPIYSGGALRSQLEIADANVSGSSARYRMAEADLELEVRTRFSELVEVEAELTFQSEAVDRLAGYLENIRLRQLAGQGLEADLLKTEAQLATQKIAVADAQLRLGQARYELNDLLGLEPRAPLAVAPLPPPSPPPPMAPPSEQPWVNSPDMQSAAADITAAFAAVAVARAERKPHLTFEVGGGFLGIADPQFPGEPVRQRAARGFGLSLTLSFDWTLFDFGSYRARLALAQIDAQRAGDARVVIYRGARLQWQRARLEMAELYRQIQLYSEAVPRSRDAYLAAESLYRGGAGTALAVLDAHRGWVDAALAALRAQLAYRTAEANARRWGGP